MLKLEQFPPVTFFIVCRLYCKHYGWFMVFSSVIKSGLKCSRKHADVFISALTDIGYNLKFYTIIECIIYNLKMF